MEEWKMFIDFLPEKKRIINTTPTSVAVRSKQTQLLSSHLLMLVLNRARRNRGNHVGMIPKPEQMIEHFMKLNDG